MPFGWDVDVDDVVRAPRRQRVDVVVGQDVVRRRDDVVEHDIGRVVDGREGEEACHVHSVPAHAPWYKGPP